MLWLFTNPAFLWLVILGYWFTQQRGPGPILPGG